jgi:hypothetical protein
MLATARLPAQERKSSERYAQLLRIVGNYENYTFLCNARPFWGRSRVSALAGGRCHGFFPYYVAGQERDEVIQ